MKPLTFGSLFAGIGGFDLGFERAGMVCEWQVEIEPFNQQVLKQHWPNARLHGDVHTFPPSNPKEWEVDLIVGGDPCQENSNARQRTGLESPSLGHEFVRVVGAIRPRLVLRENPAAVRADAPWPWWRMRSALESIGYVVLPFRLRACCLGADHQRERLFLLAERADAMQTRLEGDVIEEMAGASWLQEVRDVAGQDRRHPSPRICRAVDGIPHRTHRIKAGGNAVDVRVAEWIGRRIVAAL